MNFALIYENENGKIVMLPKSDYQIQKIDGLEQVVADAQRVRYVNVAGQKTLTKHPSHGNRTGRKAQASAFS